MERAQLHFWTAAEYLSTFLCLLFGSLAVVDHAGYISTGLKRDLNTLFNAHPQGFLPASLVDSRTWVALVFVALVFALIGGFSSRRRQLWRPSGFQAVPAPNCGYLQRMGLLELKRELNMAAPEERRESKKLFKLGERLFAENLYQAAAAAYQKSSAAVPTMSAFLNTGVCLCYRSSFQNALDSFSSGLSIARRQGNERFASAFFCNIGVTHRERGNLTEALTCFKQAYGISRKIDDFLGEACSHGNLGSLFLVQGKPDKALQPWQTALEMFEKTHQRAGLAAALDNMGALIAARNEYKAALEYHQRACKIYESIQNVPGETQSLANIGYVCLKLGKKRKALKISRKALRLAGWLNSFVDRARAHSNIGLVYEKKGRLEEALQSARKALELYNAVENPVGAGHQLLNIGVVYAVQQNRSEALKKLGEARAIFVKCGITSGATEEAIEMALRSGSYKKPYLQRLRDFIFKSVRPAHDQGDTLKIKA